MPATWHAPDGALACRAPPLPGHVLPPLDASLAVSLNDQVSIYTKIRLVFFSEYNTHVAAEAYRRALEL